MQKEVLSPFEPSLPCSPLIPTYYPRTVRNYVETPVRLEEESAKP